jgi:hypothetical protein
MRTATDSRQGEQPGGDSIWRRLKPSWGKVQQGIHSTWQRITVRDKKPPGKGARASTERLSGARHDAERIVCFVGEPLSVVVQEPGKKFDVHLPTELHVLRPKQNVWVGLWRRLIAWPTIIMLLVFSFGLSLWLIYVVPQEYCHEPVELKPAKIPIFLSLTYPKYIAGGDQGYIDVTVRNETDRPLSSTVVVDFSDDHVVCMACSGTNKVEFKDLLPRVKQTWRIVFVLNEAPRFYWSRQVPQPMRFGIKVMDVDGNKADAFLNRTIALAPFPYLRTALTSGGVISVVIALAIALLPNDWLKKVLNLE